MEETALVQRAYTAVVEHFVKTGRAPHYTELAWPLRVATRRGQAGTALGSRGIHSLLVC